MALSLNELSERLKRENYTPLSNDKYDDSTQKAIQEASKRTQLDTERQQARQDYINQEIERERQYQTLKERYKNYSDEDIYKEYTRTLETMQRDPTNYDSYLEHATNIANLLRRERSSGLNFLADTAQNTLNGALGGTANIIGGLGLVGYELDGTNVASIDAKRLLEYNDYKAKGVEDTELKPKSGLDSTTGTKAYTAYEQLFRAAEQSKNNYQIQALVQDLKHGKYQGTEEQLREELDNIQKQRYQALKSNLNLQDDMDRVQNKLGATALKYGENSLQQTLSTTGSVVGNMIPSIAVANLAGNAAGLAGAGEAATGALAQYSSLGSLGLNVNASAMNQAISDGAKYNEARLYANLNSLVEVGTELIGGENVNRLLFGNMLTGSNSLVTNQVKKFGNNFLWQLATDVAGEATEEMLSELVSPFIQYISYGGRKSDWQGWLKSNNMTVGEYWGNVLKAGYESILSTLVLGGASKTTMMGKMKVLGNTFTNEIQQSQNFTDQEKKEIISTIKQLQNFTLSNLNENYDDLLRLAYYSKEAEQLRKSFGITKEDIGTPKVAEKIMQAIAKNNVEQTNQVNTKQPKVETPKVEQPVTQPKVEQPITKPSVEVPNVEQPKVEKPKTEKPKVEEPKVETPTKPQQTETPKTNNTSKSNKKIREIGDVGVNGSSQVGVRTIGGSVLNNTYQVQNKDGTWSAFTINEDGKTITEIWNSGKPLYDSNELDGQIKLVDLYKFLGEELTKKGTFDTRINNIPVYSAIPDGWIINEGATTTPKGYVMITNGKSMFNKKNGERKIALVKEEVVYPDRKVEQPKQETPKQEKPKTEKPKANTKNQNYTTQDFKQMHGIDLNTNIEIASNSSPNPLYNWYQFQNKDGNYVVFKFNKDANNITQLETSDKPIIGSNGDTSWGKLIDWIVEENKPKTEEPKVEEPKVEKPKVEEPKVEQPKTEKPKVEKPKTKAKKTTIAEDEERISKLEIPKEEYAEMRQHVIRSVAGGYRDSILSEIERSLARVDGVTSGKDWGIFYAGKYRARAEEILNQMLKIKLLLDDEEAPGAYVDSVFGAYADKITKLNKFYGKDKKQEFYLNRGDDVFLSRRLIAFGGYEDFRDNELYNISLDGKFGILRSYVSENDVIEAKFGKDGQPTMIGGKKVVAITELPEYILGVKPATTLDGEVINGYVQINNGERYNNNIMPEELFDELAKQKMDELMKNYANSDRSKGRLDYIVDFAKKIGYTSQGLDYTEALAELYAKYKTEGTKFGDYTLVEGDYTYKGNGNDYKLYALFKGDDLVTTSVDSNLENNPIYQRLRYEGLMDKNNKPIKQKANSGVEKTYIGNSMSFNAVQAYENGKKPITKYGVDDVKLFNDILKENNINKRITLNELKQLLKKYSGGEWHHTGNKFKKTYFYDINDLIELDKNELETAIDKIRQNERNVDSDFNHVLPNETEREYYIRLGNKQIDKAINDYKARGLYKLAELEEENRKDIEYVYSQGKYFYASENNLKYVPNDGDTNTEYARVEKSTLPKFSNVLPLNDLSLVHGEIINHLEDRINERAREILTRDLGDYDMDYLDYMTPEIEQQAEQEVYQEFISSKEGQEFIDKVLNKKNGEIETAKQRPALRKPAKEKIIYDFDNVGSFDIDVEDDKARGFYADGGRTDLQGARLSVELHGMEQRRAEFVKSGATPHSGETLSPRDMVKLIADFIGKEVKVKSLRKISALGVFTHKVNTITLNQGSNADSLFHEFAHYMYHTLGWAKETKLNKGALFQELTDICEESFTGIYKSAYKFKSEGFAELYRQYISYPNETKAQYPTATAYLEEKLNADPKFAELTQNLQDAVTNWATARASELTKAEIDYNGEKAGPEKSLLKPNFGNDAKGKVDRIIYELFDRNYALMQFDDKVAQVLKAKGQRLKAIDRVYEAMRMSGSASRVVSMLGDGFEEGKVKVEGLNGILDAIKPTKEEVEKYNEVHDTDFSMEEVFHENVKDLNAYLVARRVQKYVDESKEIQISQREALLTIQEYKRERPEFAQKLEYIAQQLDNMSVNMVNYLKSNGLITPEQADAIIIANQHYISLTRASEDYRISRGRSVTNSGELKAVVGGDQYILNPLETTISNWAAMIRAVDRNNMIKTLVNQAKLLKDEGQAILEPVSTPMKLKAKVDYQEFYNSLGKQLDISEPIKDKAETIKSILFNGMKDLGKNIDLEGIIDVFAPTYDDPKKMIMSYTVGGKKKSIQFNKEGQPLYVTLNNLDAQQSNVILNAISRFNNALRFGATVYNAEFAAGNILGDAQSAFVFSGGQFIPLVDHIFGIIDMVNAEVDPNSEDAWISKMIRQSGADFSTRFTTERGGRQELAQDVLGVDKTTLVGVDHGLRNLRKAGNITQKVLGFTSEKSEQLTRTRVFKNTYKYYIEQGYSQKEALAEAAKNYRDATQDFSRTGNLGAALGKYRAFATATLGGVYNAYLMTKENPQSVATHLAVLTAITLLIKRLGNDDDAVEELNEQKKWDNFIIPTGTHNVITIKKVQGVPRIWINLVEQMYDVAMGKIPEEELFDKTIEFLGNTLETISPVSKPSDALPSFIEPFVENMANYDFYYGEPLYSTFKADTTTPAEQYTDYTSELAKYLGKAFNYEPWKIDNIIEGEFGGLGKMFLDISTQVVRGVKGNEVVAPTTSERFILNRFIADSNKSGKSVNKLYDDYETLTRKKNAGNITPEEENQLDMLTKGRNAISKMNKQMSAIRNDASLDSYQKRDGLAEIRKVRTLAAEYYTGKNISDEDADKVTIYEYYPASNKYKYTTSGGKKVEIEYTNESDKREYATKLQAEYKKELEKLQNTHAYKVASEEEQAELEDKTLSSARNVVNNEMKKILYNRYYKQ